MTTNTYRVADREFTSFTEAVRVAGVAGVEVTLIADGRRVWSPPPAPSKARVRAYQERCAAYAAQERARKDGAK